MKRAHFISLKMTDDTEDFAHPFLKEIIQHYRLLSEVIFNQDTQFTSKFWTAITDMLGIQRCLSSSYHSQTDGQTERTNRTLEDLLRNYIQYDQSDWDIWLPIVKYVYNDTRQLSIRITPFYADYSHIISPMLRQINVDTNINS